MGQLHGRKVVRQSTRARLTRPRGCLPATVYFAQLRRLWQGDDAPRGLFRMLDHLDEIRRRSDVQTDVLLLPGLLRSIAVLVLAQELLAPKVRQRNGPPRAVAVGSVFPGLVLGRQGLPTRRRALIFGTRGWRACDDGKRRRGGLLGRLPVDISDEAGEDCLGARRRRRAARIASFTNPARLRVR